MQLYCHCMSLSLTYWVANKPALNLFKLLSQHFTEPTVWGGVKTFQMSAWLKNHMFGGYVLLSISVCGSPRLMGTRKPLGSSDWSSSTSFSLESSGGGGTEFDWQTFINTFSLFDCEKVFTHMPDTVGQERRREKHTRRNFCINEQT